MIWAVARGGRDSGTEPGTVLWSDSYSKMNVFKEEKCYTTCFYQIYRGKPWVKRLQGMSVAESAIHFWGKGQPGLEMHKRVGYVGVQEVVSWHPAIENLLMIVLCLFGDKTVLWDGLSQNSLSRTVLSEKKNVVLVKDAAPKFSKPGRMVIDAFVGLLSSASLCVLLETQSAVSWTWWRCWLSTVVYVRLCGGWHSLSCKTKDQTCLVTTNWRTLCRCICLQWKVEGW